MIDLRDMDIVYLVKESEYNEELKYSLRSVSENVPHRHVCFIGGKPKNLLPDRWIHVKQDRSTKWSNTSLLLKTACLDPDISENFIMFNDDFFVLLPVEEIPYFADGPLSKRIYNLYRKYSHLTQYSLRLTHTKTLLEAESLPTVNYAVHYPIIINKKEMLDTFEKFPKGLMWRSLYGNHHKKEFRITKDCKITDYVTIPEQTQVFVSTSDKSFQRGKIGNYIRECFSRPCRWEIEEGDNE